MLAFRQALSIGNEQTPLVMVAGHGWQPGKPLLQHLARSYPVTLVSTSDLAGLQRRLAGINTACHLIGHDLGTVPALQAALSQPQKVCSLSLINPAAFGLLRQLQDWEGWDAAQRLAGNVIALHSAGANVLAARTLVKFWFGNTTWWLLRPAQKRQILRQLPSIVDALAEIYSHEPHRHDLQSLRMPVHLLCSRRAPMPTRHLAEQLQPLIPVATLSLAAQQGRQPGPAYIASSLTGWLRQLESDGGGSDEPHREAENAVWSDAT
ncbi:MAG: alpha/beta hydrolase [Oceanospirillaceae bacterium]|nr:alpha/beta hydrolase [Oceanospirillaceae bacterium]